MLTAPGYEKLEFPTTCPLCDHSPLEAESCMLNKSLRNTMRVWLQKQKKKDETRATATPQIATPSIEPTPAPADAQSQEETGDRPADSVEGAPKADDTTAEGAAPTGEDGADSSAPAVSQLNEVSSCFVPPCSSLY
jgi:hypothetical protein